jgi:uncharacterized protein (DUF1501 family)
MSVSRREALSLVAGSGASALLAQMAASNAVAQSTSQYRAIVCLFLFGGNDGFNMAVPTDARYARYASLRNPALVLPQSSLVTLNGAPFGLHPAMAPLQSVWNDGGMNLVMNTGPLMQPMDRALYLARADLRPPSLFSHSHQQTFWSGVPAFSNNRTGYFGRMYDRDPAPGAAPSAVSFAGTRVAMAGRSRTALVLPSTGTLARTGFNPSTTNAEVRARQDAIAVFASSSSPTDVLARTAEDMAQGFAAAGQYNSIISSANAAVDAAFRTPQGVELGSSIANQLRRVARVIASRGSLGHQRQIFMVSQGGFDNHSGQVTAGAPDEGLHGPLLSNIAAASAAFYNAMKALGVGRQVALFTVSDFGRIYRGNGSLGTDHAWGNIQYVVSEALRPRSIVGSYPSQEFGGADETSGDGRWIPSLSVEEYIGALAQWYGVSTTDMSYVFPNWSTWNGGGRGPAPLFSATA